MSPYEERENSVRLRDLDARVAVARDMTGQRPAIALPAAAPRVGWGVAAALAVTVVLWASAFAGIRYAVRSFEPGALALFRNTVTALALLAVAAVWKRDTFRRLSGSEWMRLAAAGVIGIAVYQLSLITGEESVDAGTASLIINTSPIFTALFALIVLREHLGVRGWVGVLLGFAGAALLITSREVGTHLALGGLFVLVASLAQAISFIIQKPLLTRLSPLAVTFWVGVFGALVLAPHAPQLLVDLQHVSRAGLLAALYLGIFPAAIGNLTWAYALSRMPAGRASTALYLTAPVALVLSWLLLGEQPAAQAIVGGAVVIGSVALVNLRARVPSR